MENVKIISIYSADYVKSVIFAVVIKDFRYDIKLGYNNIGFNGKFYTSPYFLTFLLKKFLVERKKCNK